MYNDTMGQRIKQARKKSGLTQRELGELVGAANTSISNWENDQNQPDPETIGLLCGALEVSANYLLGIAPGPSPALLSPGFMPIPKMKKVPLLGTIACGMPILAMEDADEYVDLPDEANADFCLRCKGDSMIGARIHDGDLVFIRAQDTVDEGQIAAVTLDDESTLKRVHYLPGGMTMLLAENPSVPPIVIGGPGETRTAKIRGKVVAVLFSV